MQTRVTFDGKVRNLGPWTFCCVLKFDSPLPEDHRVNILSTADSLQIWQRLRLDPRLQCLPKIEVG